MLERRVHSMRAAVSTILCLVAACGGHSAKPSEAHQTPAPAPVAEAAVNDSPPPEPVARPQPPPMSHCDRAVLCCQAYVATVVSISGGTITPEQACAGVDTAQQAGEAVCQQMIDGWRTALEAIDRPTPTECKAHPPS